MCFMKRVKIGVIYFRVLSILFVVMFCFSYQCFPFGEAVSFSSENFIDENFKPATSVFAADMDQDGDMDVIASSASYNTIAWWEDTRGDSERWEKHIVTNMFQGARSVSTVDLDGDGDLDILAAAETTHEVTWWENDGSPADGGWIEHNVVDNFNKVKRVVAADLDKDGDLDIIGAAYFKKTIAWWENDGNPRNGGWIKHDIDTDIEGASDVFVFDMDDDGDLDAVGCAGLTGNIIWYVNDGTPAEGTWSKSIIQEGYFNITSISPSDVDGDGIMDVVAVSNLGAGPSWFKNPGSPGGDLWERTLITSVGDFLEINGADLNLDSKGDFAAARIDAGTSEIFWGVVEDSSGSSWIFGNTGVTGDGNGLFAVDMDGDDDPDILGATDKGIYWAENYSILPFRKVPFSSKKTVTWDFWDAKDTCSVDMECDGDLDILGCGDKNNESLIGWWENAGEKTDWNLHEISMTFKDPYRICPADLDKDGDMDVLCISKSDNKLAWWENRNSESLGWIYHQVAGDLKEASGVKAADIDRDGHIDIVASAISSNCIKWWKNNGYSSSWTEYEIQGTSAAEPGAMDVADINGDGWIDVAATSKSDFFVYWYENDGPPGDGAWEQHPALAIGKQYLAEQDIRAADMDNDGDIDLFLGGRGYYPLFSENLDGAGGLWSYNAILTANLKSYATDLADVDMDGDLDFFSADLTNNGVYWFENTGGGSYSWTEHFVDLLFETPTTLTAGDFDRDGLQDAAATNNRDGNLHWWKNKMIHSSPSFAPPDVISDTIDNPVSVIITDVNSDGLPDIVAASFDDNRVAWYENISSDSLSFNYHLITSDGYGPVQIEAGDINRDGKTDVLVCSKNGNRVQWLENRLPGDWNRHLVVDDVKSPSSAMLGDLNNDGWPDVIVARQPPVIGETRYMISCFLNDGTPTSTIDGNWEYCSVHTSGIAAGPVQLALGDFNNDARLDIAATYQGAGLIRWFENGDGKPLSFTQRGVSDILNSPAGIAVGDMENDGNMDIIVSAFGSGTELIEYYRNDGSPSDGGWYRRNVAEGVEDVTKLKVLDLDCDGDMDVISNFFKSGMINATGIKWFASDGSSLPQYVGHTITSDFGAFNFTSFDAGDFDNDGDLDIAASSSNDSLQWYLNRGGQFSLVTRDVAPATLQNGDLNAFLKITINHKGRGGDTWIEPATLHLLLEEAAGDPLTQEEAHNLIRSFSFYHDDGSNDFEPESDTLIKQTNDYTVEKGGHVMLQLPDRHPDMYIESENTETYFLVVELTGWASGEVPNSFRIGHVTESSSTAQDRDYDINLNMSFSSNRTTKIVETVGTVVTPTPTPTPTSTPGINLIMSY